MFEIDGTPEVLRQFMDSLRWHRGIANFRKIRDKDLIPRTEDGLNKQLADS